MKVYTNDTTDLAVKILTFRYRYPDGRVKAKVSVFNKFNKIVYETKNVTLSPRFFEWNYRIS